MSIRVAQWTTGNVGRQSVEAVGVQGPGGALVSDDLAKTATGKVAKNAVRAEVAAAAVAVERTW